MGTRLLALSLLCCVSTGCRGRAVGITPDGGTGWDGRYEDFDVYPLADAGPPDAAHALYGHIRVNHVLYGEMGDAHAVTLTAAFYKTPYTPPEAYPPELMETRLTPDGVQCASFFCSGMDPGCPPDLPPGPDQIDGGRIRAEGTDSGGEMLEVDFTGDRYTVDRRSDDDPLNPLPGWLTLYLQPLLVWGDGSADVASFYEHIELPPFPIIDSPSRPSETLSISPGGNYEIRWDLIAHDETLVRIEFDMDPEYAVFLCRPDRMVTSMLLPRAWIDWTWGDARLLLSHQNNVETDVPFPSVLIQARRTVSWPVYFGGLEL